MCVCVHVCVCVCVCLCEHGNEKERVCRRSGENVRENQYNAVCCSVLQCVAVCCSVLQCVAVCVQEITRERARELVCCSVL